MRRTVATLSILLEEIAMNISRFGFSILCCGAILVPCFADDREFAEFTSKEGKFTVLFPGKPKETKRTLQSPFGPVELNSFSVSPLQPVSTYVVIFSDYPANFEKKSDADFLDSSRDGSVKNSGGKLLSEKKLTLDKYPGRELLLEAPNQGGLFRQRIFIVGNRLYQLIVGGAEEVAKSKGADKFLDSFKLQEPSDWQEYTVKECGFKVVLPGKPSKREKELQGPTGKFSMTMFGFNTGQAMNFYGVYHTNYPSDVPIASDDSFLDELRDRLLPTFKGKLISEQKLKLDKRPGRELLIESELHGILRYRIYLDGRRVYQVVVGGSDTFVKSKDTDKFFDSFKLIE
jgi:hypothetical protein